MIRKTMTLAALAVSLFLARPSHAGGRIADTHQALAAKLNAATKGNMHVKNAYKPSDMRFTAKRVWAPIKPGAPMLRSLKWSAPMFNGTATTKTWLIPNGYRTELSNFQINMAPKELLPK